MRWTYKTLASVATLAGALCATPAGAVNLCFEQAGARYGVSPLILQAIAQQESGMNPKALNRNRNGTRDIGIMQINSSWLRFLAHYHINESDLLDACTNIHVGAWILGSNFQRMGVSWEAIGAYNAVSPDKRARYATQVIGRLRHLLREAM
ncbi:lytic transglycosylase domain-containing protein [Herbaspirillum frisingense]|uniref:lytic transglycosylase domain-containing protein n=1 Tax=Herbaspirillum frisingense TaxID=92645 RepID=UPI001F248634|nr:lytic transglycosylase domain-containing protein [Herbaspirillum frisingense]UIN19852.1 lytic transglycosylase domain-containing protein [Herbaspirillum frisingense]